MDDYYLRRAGPDYWEHLEWEVVDDWESLLERLSGRQSYFFTKSAERAYTDVAFQPGDVFFFGSESQGLPKSMLDGREAHSLRVPIRPQVRSLNLSNCVAVVLYEAARQTGSR